MNLLEKFKHTIKTQDLFQQKDKLLIAVSGGVDSVVLCELCHQAGHHFSIAHCNFRLRDKESERDAAFARELASKYKVDFFLKEVDTKNYAEEKKLSIQEAARSLRYVWFDEIANRQLAPGIKQIVKTIDYPVTTIDYILTAHHADDNIETLMMNFFRGTGLNGLTGIAAAPAGTKIRRPLLNFWKEELIAFAKENKLGFVEDSSNLESKYTRNYFRNEIIPLISKKFPQVKQNLRDNIERFREIHDLYKDSVNSLKKKIVRTKNNEIHIPIKLLLTYNNRALIYEVISEFGFSEKQVDEVIKLADSDSGKYILSPKADKRIIKFRNWFIISDTHTSGDGMIVIEKETKFIELGELKLKFEDSESTIKPSTSITIACLDAREIQFPLILRKWKQGDYFYPLGMKKKKKVSRFLIDQKIPVTEKEKLYVIEMNKKIIWLVGMRIDDRFKITGNTQKVLKISLHSSNI